MRDPRSLLQPPAICIDPAWEGEEGFRVAFLLGYTDRTRAHCSGSHSGVSWRSVLEGDGPPGSWGCPGRWAQIGLGGAVTIEAAWTEGATPSTKAGTPSWH